MAASSQRDTKCFTTNRASTAGLAQTNTRRAPLKLANQLVKFRSSAAGKLHPGGHEPHFVRGAVRVFGLEARALLLEVFHEIGLDLFDLHLALHSCVGAIGVFRHEKLVSSEEHSAT